MRAIRNGTAFNFCQTEANISSTRTINTSKNCTPASYTDHMQSPRRWRTKDKSSHYQPQPTEREQFTPTPSPLGILTVKLTEADISCHKRRTVSLGSRTLYNVLLSEAAADMLGRVYSCRQPGSSITCVAGPPGNRHRPSSCLTLSLTLRLPRHCPTCFKHALPLSHSNGRGMVDTLSRRPG